MMLFLTISIIKISAFVLSSHERVKNIAAMLFSKKNQIFGSYLIPIIGFGFLSIFSVKVWVHLSRLGVNYKKFSGSLSSDSISIPPRSSKAPK